MKLKYQILICMLDEKTIMNVIFAIFIFPFSPSMSNKLMMYGHTLCFLKKKFVNFLFHKIKLKIHVYPKKFTVVGNSRN
jgi:hypothetical protein